MQKLTLAENMWLYTFPDQDMHINILALIHDNGAFLVDTGFPEQATSIKNDLAKHGITAQFVFNTHYNLDHIAGNEVFSGAEFLGSEHYALHLERAKKFMPNLKCEAPSVLLTGGERMTFGSFNLKFIHTPGHTNCSMTLRINCHTLHVGDNLVRLSNGTNMVPYHMHPDSSIAPYIETLELTKRMAPQKTILSHAGVIEGEQQISRAIDARLHYMRKLQALGANAKLEDCLTGELKPNDTSRQWHEYNCKVLFAPN